MSRDGKMGRPARRPRTRRAALRSGVGVAVGSLLAGCQGGGSGSGGDDGSGGGPDGSSGDDGGDDTGGGASTPSTRTRTTNTPAAPASCTELDDGYTAFDAGESSIVAEFDYPALFGELDVQANVQAIAKAERPAVGGPDRRLFFDYTQLVQGRGRSTLQGIGDTDRAIATTIDFGGEEVPVINNPNSPRYKVDLQTSLPYDVDGETRYFRTTVTIGGPNTDDVPADCRDAMVAAARHLVDSLEQNPDSTIAEAQA